MHCSSQYNIRARLEFDEETDEISNQQPGYLMVVEFTNSNIFFRSISVLLITKTANLIKISRCS